MARDSAWASPLTVWQRLGPRGQQWALLLAAVVVLLAIRLPFLAPRLEDIDSINFDLGVHDYNPVLHQPHPPGYPVYILFAKIAHTFIDGHAVALASVSAVLGSLSIIPLFFLLRALTSRQTAVLAAVFTMACPLLWFSGVRPMSDLSGLCVALLAQCLLITGAEKMTAGIARGRRVWQVGAIVAGLAVGVRLQAGLLVGPMLLYGWIRHRGIRLATCAWLAASIGAWLAPVLWYSGGSVPFLRSLGQLLQDALPVEPLVLHPTIRRVAAALGDTLIAPWGTIWIAAPILLLAVVGALVCLRSNRRALGFTLMLFGPYALYHFLWQMTATIRYALPIVPAVALLASLAVFGWPRLAWRRPLAIGVAVLFVAASSVRTLPALAAYHGTPSPGAQALDYLHAIANPQSVLVSGHYMFNRYLSRLGSGFDVRMPVVQQELRPLFEYWKAGGRKPVFFLKNPQRLSLLFMGRDSQTRLQRWDWPEAVSPLMKGERPLVAELWRLDPPRWITASGFLVSPEAGSPDQVAQEPHRLYLRPSSIRRALIATGTLPDRESADIALQIGNAVRDRFRVRQEFTVQTMVDPVPGAGTYIPVAFVTSAPVLFTDVWVTPDSVPSIRPAKGFNIPERDAAGALFRWTGPRAEAAVYLPIDRGRLKIRGQVPLKYYDTPVTVSLTWNGRPLASFPIATASFEYACDLPHPKAASGWGMLGLTSSQSFVPNERQHNGDRRQLALRIDELTLVPATAEPSAPGGG